jgi:hypothetical protein
VSEEMSVSWTGTVKVIAPADLKSKVIVTWLAP